MGIFNKLIIGGVAALISSGVVQNFRTAQESSRRRNTPVQFDGKVSQQDFIQAANRVAKKVPRVTIIASDMTVYLEVRSNSGLSSWRAQLDFNDYGRLTGRYWISSENTQSPIPEFFARTMQEEIRKLLG